MSSPLRFSLLAAGVVVGAWSAARAEPASPPPFDQALAAAARAGKPLVLDFGASWCQPCKELHAALARPEAHGTLDLVHLVSYDAEVTPGREAARRFDVSEYPTLVVVDARGKEVARNRGFGGLERTLEFLSKAPEQAMPIEEGIARARREPQNLALQSLVGRRLADAHRGREARFFLDRAAKSQDRKLAAAAVWRLATLAADEQSREHRRKGAEALVRRYPETAEAELALRFLATLPDPPASLVADGIRHRLSATAPTRDALDRLARIALAARTLDAAADVAGAIEKANVPDDERATPLMLVAEIHHRRGDRERAVATAERALERASPQRRARLSPELARFREGDRRKEGAFAALDARTERATSPPAWIEATGPLTRKMDDECREKADRPRRIEAFVMTGKRPDETRVIPREPVPAALTACLEKTARGQKLPPSVGFSVFVSLAPRWQAEAMRVAHASATACLPPVEAGEVVEPIQVVVTHADGKPQLVLPGADPALLRCLSRAFWFVRFPSGEAQALRIVPPRRQRKPEGPPLLTGTTRPTDGRTR